MNKTSRRALAAAAALTLGTGLALGTASAAQAVDTWTITSLTLNNPIVIDAFPTSGDDGGLLSVTESYVLRDGNAAVYAYDLLTLTPFAEAGAGPDADFNYASDLKTSTAYLIDAAGEPETISQLTQLDNEGNITATVITLSESIDMNSEAWYLMSGFGWIGFWEHSLGSLKVIDPATGAVTTVDANTRADFSPAPSDQREDLGVWDGGGVGMFDGTDYWFVATDTGGDISQFNLTGTAQTSVMLANVHDVGQSDQSDTFTVSACDSRFYIHDEGPGTLWFNQDVTGMAEPLLSADATFSRPCGDPPAPVLPDTGVDAGTTTAVAAGLAVLGALAIIVVRRRRANVG
jgi:LPXTG-motif cell wall-anchored protein